MIYWKMAGLTLGVIIFSSMASLLLVQILYNFNFIDGQKSFSWWSLFFFTGVLLLLAYFSKKGLIFSWMGSYLVEKPSSSFYVRFFYLLIIFIFLAIFSLLNILKN